MKTHVTEQHTVKWQKIKGLNVNYTSVPNLFNFRERFRGRYFFCGPRGEGGGWGDGFGMIQALYIYCALYF